MKIMKYISILKVMQLDTSFSEPKIDKILKIKVDWYLLFYLHASSIAIETDTVAPTIDLLPISISPIISKCASNDKDLANCASLCIFPIVLVISNEAGHIAKLSGWSLLVPLLTAEKFFFALFNTFFLYVPATGCWKRVWFVEFPVIDTPTSTRHIIPTSLWT